MEETDAMNTDMEKRKETHLDSANDQPCATPAVDIDENGDIVTVEVAKNVRMDFTRSAVSQIVKKKKQSS